MTRRAQNIYFITYCILLNSLPRYARTRVLGREKRFKKRFQFYICSIAIFCRLCEGLQVVVTCMHVYVVWMIYCQIACRYAEGLLSISQKRAIALPSLYRRGLDINDMAN